MPLDEEIWLADSVADLNQEVRVLREAIDELRETLQWISQNKGAEQTYSLLKSFPQDMTAEDWDQRVEITTGQSAIVAQRANELKTEQAPPAKPPTGDTLF